MSAAIRGVACLIFIFVATVFSVPDLVNAADWKPAAGPLMTRWATDVSPQSVHPEYPRPQLVRDAWQNLNGLWDYAIRPKAEPQPTMWDGQILVPFPVESALSGVMKRVGQDNRLWYRREFSLPASEAWQGQRVLLHFGACDWETTVIVNGRKLEPVHRGGYDPFSLDITDALLPTGSQEIVVSVWDPTTAGFQPVGKQHNRPEGIWYTPTTGIWQTIWLEPVPRAASIDRLVLETDIDSSELIGKVVWRGPAAESMTFEVLDGDRVVVKQIVAAGKDAVIRLKIPDAKLWSPDAPFLYDLRVTAMDGGKPRDTVRSYFGMRKSSLGKDEQGITRLMLNNKPLFQFGPLDQGFWPDGLYTAPTDAALRYDIEITKQLGFNMARKHVKVEPARWYYWCDKLGLIVWQDMPSGDKHAQWSPDGRHDNTETKRPQESSDNFDRELRAMIDTLHNHPSIVMWVPFNEGWGQFDTVRVTNWIKQYDPTRLVNCASGGNDFPVGDVHDIHIYPGPGSPQPEEKRAAVLGEYGGLGLPVKGHTWQDEKNWGYRSFTDVDSLTSAYRGLLTNLHPLIAKPGLSAAIYTQTTDVEIEINGLLTYDRAIIKIDPKVLATGNKRLYGPPPTIKLLVPTALDDGHSWQFTTEKPTDDNWFQPKFNADTWKNGPGGFGEPTTPGTKVRTSWKSPDIWIRREFELTDDPATLRDPHLLMHYDEDAEVYINGKLAAKTTGFTTQYSQVPIRPEARATLKRGANTIAIHCHQTGGGQYIDAGLIDIVHATPK